CGSSSTPCRPGRRSTPRCRSSSSWSCTRSRRKPVRAYADERRPQGPRVGAFGGHAGLAPARIAASNSGRRGRGKERRVPHRPALTEEPVDDFRSRFVIEPLEPGFGYTIGNSLRRTLLSSIPGAAVTSIRIEGVLHEFSTVAGVKEDVTDIILNLK